MDNKSGISQSLWLHIYYETQENIEGVHWYFIFALS